MIEYHFAFDDGSEATFQVDLDRGHPPEVAGLPDWTELSYQQCPRCPLGPGYRRCPPAVDAAQIFERFSPLFSFHRAVVTVRTEDREYRRDCDHQMALQSLIGLVMATSACPILGELRAMAWNHLPFATPKETLYRTVANHLLKQYFKRRRGEPSDTDALESLHQLYADLQEVNGAFVKRIQAAAKQDANLNALVLLFTVSALVQHSLDDGLSDLAALYEPPLQATGAASDED